MMDNMGNKSTSCHNADVSTNVAAAAANLDATNVEKQETYSQVSQQMETKHSLHDHSLGDTLIRAKQLQDEQVPENLLHVAATKVDNNNNSDSNGLEKVIDSVTKKQDKKVDVDCNKHGKHTSLDTVNNRKPSEAEQCASMSTPSTAVVQHQQLLSAATMPTVTVSSRPPRLLVLPTAAKDSVRRHYDSSTLQATASRLIATSAANSLSQQNNAVNNTSSAQPECLLVAVPVEEDEVDAYAVSHDVSQNEMTKRIQMIQSRRHSCRLYFVVFLLVAAAAMITSLVVILRNKKNGQEQETEQETETMLLQNMTQLIMSIMGADAVLLNDASSPYAKALTWLLQSSERNHSQAMTSTLAQRFYLASFYYDTTTDDDKWRLCNPPTNSTSELNQTCNDSLFQTTDTRYAWLSDSHECDWAGVRCDYHQRINGLGFKNMSLVGTFPSSIAKFPFLQYLYLGLSRLEGHILLLSDCHHLTYILVNDNLLSGDLSSVWQHCKLVYLWADDNHFTGSLSSQIGNCGDLHYLSLFNNKLTGTVPSEIGWLDNIYYFEIGNNHFRGELPLTMQFWSTIRDFYVSGNSFSGSIPTFLGQLNKTLLDLELYDNNFTGTLPDELFHLSELYYLGVANNELNGTLDACFAQLTSLQTNRSIFGLDLSGNHFTGTIPTELGLLADLFAIALQGNDFHGSVPASLCRNRFDPHFTLVANCATDGNGQVELQCNCCTSCCQADGTQCKLK